MDRPSRSGDAVSLRSRPDAASRRAVLTTAAWAVPAIVVSTPVPAWAAASAPAPVSISTPGDEVPPSGEVWLTVTVRSAQATPLGGQSVSLSGPPGARFGSASGTTDGTGAYSTFFDLADPSATPGSTVTVTAVVGGSNGAVALTVVGPEGSCTAG